MVSWLFRSFFDAGFLIFARLDMDKHVGDLHSMIVDRELEIVQTLLEDVLTFSEAMLKACEVCAELDCLLSFAQASRTNNYVRPDMVEENVIDIVQGR